MNLHQRLFLALALLVLFGMLMYLMPDNVSQVRMGTWAILMQIGLYGLLLSRSKE